MGVFKTEIDDQNVHINNVYSLDNKNTHKKEFEYQHRYKYRSKINTDDSDLRIDRIEYYKNEQNKIDNSKKKIDNILLIFISKFSTEDTKLCIRHLLQLHCCFNPHCFVFE